MPGGSFPVDHLASGNGYRATCKPRRKSSVPNLAAQLPNLHRFAAKRRPAKPGEESAQAQRRLRRAPYLLAKKGLRSENHVGAGQGASSDLVAIRSAQLGNVEPTPLDLLRKVDLFRLGVPFQTPNLFFYRNPLLPGQHRLRYHDVWAWPSGLRHKPRRQGRDAA